MENPPTLAPDKRSRSLLHKTGVPWDFIIPPNKFRPAGELVEIILDLFLGETIPLSTGDGIQTNRSYGKKQSSNDENGGTHDSEESKAPAFMSENGKTTTHIKKTQFSSEEGSSHKLMVNPSLKSCHDGYSP